MIKKGKKTTAITGNFLKISWEKEKRQCGTENEPKVKIDNQGHMIVSGRTKMWFVVLSHNTITIPEHWKQRNEKCLKLHNATVFRNKRGKIIIELTQYLL